MTTDEFNRCVKKTRLGVNRSHGNDRQLTGALLAAKRFLVDEAGSIAECAREADVSRQAAHKAVKRVLSESTKG